MKLPAGLFDDDLELVVNNGQLMAFHAVKIMQFCELPDYILDLIEVAMLANTVVFKEIKAMLPPNATRIQLLYQYSWCLHGGLDDRPDVTQNGESNPEHWDCPFRGKCNSEGKVCSSLKVANGHLTRREIEYLKLVTQGKLDKEIAPIMGISLETVPSYKKQLQEKTGLHTKTELAVWAIERGLI
jgi:DNA-binding CsgD family transcriptional regulator